MARDDASEGTTDKMNDATRGWTDAINGVSWLAAEWASKSKEYKCAFSAGRAWLESMTTKGEER